MSGQEEGGLLRAVSSFHSQKEGHLSFSVGDIITVVDKLEGRIDMEGWCQGKLRNDIGIFPLSMTENLKLKEPYNSKLNTILEYLQKQSNGKSNLVEDLKKDFNNLQSELLSSPGRTKYKKSKSQPATPRQNMGLKHATAISGSSDGLGEKRAMLSLPLSARIRAEEVKPAEEPTEAQKLWATMGAKVGELNRTEGKLRAFLDKYKEDETKEDKPGNLKTDIQELNKQLKAIREEANILKFLSEREAELSYPKSPKSSHARAKTTSDGSPNMDEDRKVLKQTAEEHKNHKQKIKYKRKSAPRQPKNSMKVNENEEDLGVLEYYVQNLVDEKTELADMLTKLVTQVRNFLIAPPPHFMDSHMKEQITKLNEMVKDNNNLKSQNETLQRKVSEQKKKIKELEKNKPKLLSPRPEESEQEHVVESQTNTLLSQLKQLREAATALGVNTKGQPDVVLITSERKLQQQLDHLKQKLSESRSRELQLELDLITTKEELNKLKVAMDLASLIS
eukprot:TRINITY_DN14125_c0_g1_i1.p1 TRINITY_DN14125_c0_g1~~TRINITY_DN14125_c0_g1_i1.p1  ORF type:complete len:506 (+),score=141.08 TRINITY_DN14125_c0_g1_i1:16-1533(+)